MASSMNYNNTYTVSIPSIAAQLVNGGIGWNQHFTALHSALAESNEKYPPHNIYQVNEDKYVIEMAVAGFDKDMLAITVKDGVLRVKGDASCIEDAESEFTYLHHGIKMKSFDKSFPLAEHVEVNGAKYENGLLEIALSKSLPEELLPKTIKIK